MKLRSVCVCAKVRKQNEKRATSNCRYTHTHRVRGQQRRWVETTRRQHTDSNSSPASPAAAAAAQQTTSGRAGPTWSAVVIQLSNEPQVRQKKSSPLPFEKKANSRLIFQRFAIESSSVHYLSYLIRYLIRTFDFFTFLN